jgi:hypothetical protein
MVSKKLRHPDAHVMAYSDVNAIKPDTGVLDKYTSKITHVFVDDCIYRLDIRNLWRFIYRSDKFPE